MSLFTSDAKVIKLGIEMMKELMPLYFTYVCTEVFGGGIRGCGETFIPMLLTGCGVCLIRIFWTIGVSIFNGNVLILIEGLAVSWIVTSLAFIIYYIKGNWMEKCIGKCSNL
jgi:Na+-driven multidrug efflux pump